MSGRNMITRLPAIEITLCFLVWIVHCFAAFYIAWNVSFSFRHKIALKASEYGSEVYINDYEKDHTDSEWEFYCKSLNRILIINILHMVLFKICPFLLPKRLSQCLLLVFWVAAEVFFTSATCVTVVFILAVVMGILAKYWRNELVYWFILIMFIVKIHSIINFDKIADVYYREFNYYLYSAIKILNFCIYLLRTKDINITPSLFFRYMQYIFYPPYSIVLIVLFNDFDAEMAEIENGSAKCINCRVLLIRLVRIVAWFLAFEIILHFIHVHAVLAISPALFNTLNEYELASISYVNGKLFYIKYLLIFGIPSWFALADGMKPPAGPVCISRISKYSQMWRSFDRGLYIFLKKQLYMPVSGDPSSKYFSLRRFAALGTVFLFVLAWHGISSNYFYWVLLNSLEISIEWFGVSVSKTAFYSKIRNFLGPRGERRLIAFLMITTAVPGIFGVFFFLSRKEIGIIIFKRLFINLVGTVMQFTLNLPNRSLYYYAIFAHFIVLGYCFNHVCLELEKYYTVKQVSGDEVKRKIL
ncbi:hhat protein [Loa loa]|uniref:Hhat protein n=2 Tax=Loa loa TaxID=7209 RepID=A0A1S0TI99_LOALO|nr:hhat protein [Loa loa]EFO14321.2 hhat protein [Loa loa]